MDLPVVAGRIWNASDVEAREVVVSLSLARRAADMLGVSVAEVVGRRILKPGADTREAWYTIAGIVPDIVKTETKRFATMKQHLSMRQFRSGNVAGTVFPLAFQPNRVHCLPIVVGEPPRHACRNRDT